MLAEIGNVLLSPLRFVVGIGQGIYSAIGGAIGGGLNLAVTGAMSGVGALALGYLFKDPIKAGLDAVGATGAVKAADAFEANNPHIADKIMKAALAGAGAGFAIGAAPAVGAGLLAPTSGIAAQTIGAPIGAAVAAVVGGLGLVRGAEALTGKEILPPKESRTTPPTLGS